MATIIGSIVCDPAVAVTGQSVAIEVFSPSGERLDGRDDVVVTINGVTGARQFLQFDFSGTKSILVTAAQDGQVETNTATLEIVEPDMPEAPPEGRHLLTLRNLHEVGLPLLKVARSPNRPYSVGFGVGRWTQQFSDGLTSGPSIGQSIERLATRARRVGTVELVKTGLLSRLAVEAPFHVQPPPATVQYHWDFGDGTKVTTADPNVRHDFEAALAPDREHQTFHVKVRIETPDGQSSEVIRTLSVFNGYAMCKRLGHLIPRVTSTSFATAMLAGYQASFTVSNAEDFPLVLTSSQVQPILLETEEANLPLAEEVLRRPIRVEPHSSASVSVTVSQAQVPKGAAGFTIYYHGATPDGLPICLEAHFDIDPKDRTGQGLKLGDFAVTHFKSLRDQVLAVVNPPVHEEHAQEGELYAHPGDVAQHIGQVEEQFGEVAHHAGHVEQQLGQVEEQFGEVAHHAGHVEQQLGQGEEQFGEVAHHAGPVEQHVLEDFNAGFAVQQLGAMRAMDLASQVAGVAALSEAQFQFAAASQLLQPVPTSELHDSLIRSALEKRFLTADIFLHPPQPDPVDGQECDPDNVGEGLEGWVCQATAETRQVITPGRFMNARKGDIILSPGGLGPIGGLLKQVTPPQRYSHAGIMTRNYDEITHSTASQDRIEAYPVGSILGESQPSDGHRPDVVKYAWPGVIRQSVEAAIHGEDWIDPESGKAYSISSFSPHNESMEMSGNWEIVPPMVVKPHPRFEREKPEIRPRLRQIANDARALAGHAALKDAQGQVIDPQVHGKSHYRFFCYTDPTIGVTSVAPPEAGWAAGTFPSVCSVFIWKVLKQNGIHLESDAAVVAEGDLEAIDRAAGGQVDGATPDGLYLYSADERRAAGEFLYRSIHDKVMAKIKDKAGISAELVNLFADMADDVANQFCNAFAKDWADTAAKDSGEWRNVGASNAVSPDNILLWDSPDLNGLYGFAAPLVYREPRLDTITVHRWKKVQLKGTLSGTVRYQGQPTKDALVQLFDGLETYTDDQGGYTLRDVPFGPYEIKVQKDNMPVFLSAKVPADIHQPATVVDIDLQGPPDLFRMLKISGKMHIVDYETFGHDEIVDRPFYKELFVGPFGTHAEYTFVEKMGGEVRVEFRVVTDWHLDKSTGIYYEVKFFEGDSEDTDDLDGETHWGFNLLADSWQSWHSNIDSRGAGSVDIDVTFENAVNPN